MVFKKKSQGEIITIVLIILIVIAAVVIVWNAVKKVIQDAAGGIDTDIFSVDLKISKVVIDYTGKRVQFAVERGSDSAEVAKLFVYMFGKDSSGKDLTLMYELKSPGNPVPLPLETKIYNYFNIDGFLSGSITKIIVYAVSPKDKKGIAFTYIITGKEPSNPFALGGTGVPWSSVPINPILSLNCEYGTTWTDKLPIDCCNPSSGSGKGKKTEIKKLKSGSSAGCPEFSESRCTTLWAACDGPPGPSCTYSTTWINDIYCYTGGCTDPKARRQTRTKTGGGSECTDTQQCIADSKCIGGCYALWGYGWGFGCGHGTDWGYGKGVCCGGNTVSDVYGWGFGCSYGHGYGLGFGCKCDNPVWGYEDSDYDNCGYGNSKWYCDGLPSGYSLNINDCDGNEGWDSSCSC